MKPIKIIISFFIAIMVASSAYLFWVSDSKQDLNNQKDLWMIYFVEPKGNDWDFTIENHSDSESFYYDVFDGKEKIYNGDVLLKKGEKRIIKLNSAVGHIEKKILIQVSDGKNKKEIYKNY